MKPRSPYSLLLAAVVSAAVVSCGDDVSIVAPPPTPTIRTLAVAPLSAVMRPGENLIMVAHVQADSGADRAVLWSTADPRRLTVTANGIVTAVAEGFATVTATSRARPDLASTATVQVLPAPTVRAITLFPGTLTMRAGQSVPMVANVQADSGTDRTVVWSSADPSRLSVSATGVVTGIAEGTAVVTATSLMRPDIAGSAAVTILPSASVRTIAVTPASVDLTTGAQQALAVVVQADDGVSRAVTFASSNPAVATVTAAGIITGVSPGSAVVTIGAVAAPAVTSTVVVSVRPPAPPRVSIQSVTQGGTANPVNLQAVGGQLDVTINIDAGQDPLSTVDLVVNQNGQDKLVATQAFTGSIVARPADVSAPALFAPVVLSFRTDRYDDATGEVSFKNGTVTIRAIAKAQASGTAASQAASNTVQLTLVNPDGFHVSLQALSATSIFNATDASGRAWVQAGRGLVVRSIPVMYSGRVVGVRGIGFPGNAPVATMVSTKTGIAVDTLQLPGYSAPATGPAYEAGELPAMIGVSTLGETLTTFVGTAGSGGAGILNAQPLLLAGTRLVGIRVDNLAPPAGANFVISTASANSNNWINGRYSFASGMSGIVPDAGVGLVGSNTAPTASTAMVDFRVTGGGLADTTSAQQGSALSASNTHLAYRAQARYTDRLGNTRNVALSGAAPNPLSTFGVDLAAPSVRYLTSPPPGSASIGFSSDSVYRATVDVAALPFVYGIEAIDDRAGFGATPVEVTLERLGQPNPPGLFTGTRTCVIGTVVAGLCTPGAVALGAVLVDGYRQLTTPLDGGSSVEGYYTWAGIVRDQAGNASATIRKRVLYDQGVGASAPAVASAGAPGFLRGGQPVTFQPVAADNVELVSGQLYVTYPNLPTTTTLAYEGGAAGTFPVGTAFDSVLTSPLFGASGFTVASFLRAIESVDAAEAPQAYAAATVKPNGANVVLRDVPNVTPATLATNTLILSGMVETAPGTPGFINRTGSEALLKWRRFAGATSPLRMEAVGPSGQTESPFVRVILARLEAGVAPNAQVWRVLNEVTTTSIQDNGIERVWRYDLGGLAAGSYIAIGVTVSGDAIVSRVIVI